ncbi:fluoride efflux transporter CrcB [Polynucleobacter sp. IMCC30063]|uniref:fluoride efflux transporter CrcB n=1 Tax=unclassified Polynucleobacter TaxID=2640945 RepID=UPI001F20B65B|nr:MULTISPECIES: fluoride efflux transporter CrcB [unclassified Polynucleobacter]MCE7504820.1 fluoride efflux transporter CrcB [Polynucleobacter sp. IMCC30063]MCE7526376.1 fluoride efflux transporter CrcB [Polynucleobacter sp. IMCC 30228]MCE7529662.1 fluoride efflux transporter CrcB [Polynucleobacter sp. IMCC 29146]
MFETLHPIILVALGGAVGSVCRYKLSGFVLYQTINWRFPLGTFLVNVIGCLAIGILAGLILKFELFSSQSRLFLITGIMGGFTTFSAFGLETFYLIREKEFLVAGSYVLASVIAGLLVLSIGFLLVPSRN